MIDNYMLPSYSEGDLYFYQTSLDRIKLGFAYYGDFTNDFDLLGHSVKYCRRYLRKIKIRVLFLKKFFKMLSVLRQKRFLIYLKFTNVINFSKIYYMVKYKVKREFYYHKNI